jgi:hypothetical protein
MSLFKSIGKALGSVGKVVGKVVKTVAPVASVIPGVGTLVSAGASVLGNVLDPPKQKAIVDAVEQQGVVKVEKIEQTILKDNPNVDAATLQAAAVHMTQQALSSNPTASVDDSKSVTTISSGTKIIQWVKSNAILVVGAVGGLFFFMSNKNGGSRRYRRY